MDADNATPRPSRASEIAYVAGALGLGVVNALAAGASLNTAEGLGYASGAPIAGAIIGGIAKFFRRSADVPRWMFWWSLLSLGLQSIKRP